MRRDRDDTFSAGRYVLYPSVLDGLAISGSGRIGGEGMKSVMDVALPMIGPSNPVIRHLARAARYEELIVTCRRCGVPEETILEWIEDAKSSLWPVIIYLDCRLREWRMPAVERLTASWSNSVEAVQKAVNVTDEELAALIDSLNEYRTDNDADIAEV